MVGPDLSRSSALVLGGASGLGLATAQRLAGRCGHVVVADVQTERRTEVEALGAHVSFLTADATDPESVRAAVAETHGRLPLRVAVASAGVIGHGRVLGREAGRTLEDFARIVQVNLVGTAALLVHAAEAMAQNDPLGDDRGVVVMTSSIAATDGGHLGYAASKAGVAGMTLSAAHGLATHAVRVVTIAPGIFQTAMFASGGAVVEALADAVPHPGRLGDPDEFAALVEHVVDNAMLNGSVLRLDAAMRLPRLNN